MGVHAFLAVDQLHQQRPLHVELGHLVERGRWQDDLGAKVELRPVVAGGHDDGVASVVFIESLHPGHTTGSSWVVAAEATVAGGILSKRVPRLAGVTWSAWFQNGGERVTERHTIALDSGFLEV